MIAEVIIDIKHYKLNQTYDYFIPDEFLSIAQKGMRVIVPFTDNNIERLGFIVNIKDKSVLAEKEIKEFLDITPILSKESFLMIDYLLENPSTLISKAYETLMPSDLLIDYEKKVSLVNEDLVPENILHNFNKKREWVLKSKDSKHLNLLKRLESQGIVKLETILKPKYETKPVIYVQVSNPNFKGTDKQNDCFNYCLEQVSVLRSELNKMFSPSIVSTLVKRNIFELIEKIDHLIDENYIDEKELKPLLDKSTEKFNEIKENLNNDNTYLLYGKNEQVTSIRMNLIKEVITKNKQVLILVPERFLIENHIDSLKQYFPKQLITALKSDDTKRVKYQNHQAILNGNSLITVGARGSIFTEFKNLSLIIMLESHDSSYIQQESIYYDTFELSLIRSKYNKIPLILESNIITINQNYLINKNEINKLDLRDFNDKKALITIIDMKDELKSGNTKMLSRDLKESIDKSIKKNERVLLIMNQKGYAPFVMCRSCGFVPKDPETDIPLNYMAREKILRSGLTKYEEHFTKVCSNCGQETMRPVGSGIEQLEQYLKIIYPNEPILRVDSDSINNKNLYRLIDNIDNSDVKIIIGTQMALKSTLNKKVSLVGILMYDQFLKVPKYNASEDAYIILNESIFMAKDKVIIQSYDKNHYSLLSINDENIFYEKELANRKLTNMPPFSKLLQVLLMGDSYLKTYQKSMLLKNELISLGHKVLGPTQSVILKENEKYRFLLLVKYKKIDKQTLFILNEISNISIRTFPGITWI